MSEYHWYWRREKLPKTIRNPSGRGSSSRLFIACRQTTLPAKQQKALVKEWCEVLPTLDHVMELRFLTKVPQILFDAACRLPNAKVGKDRK